MPELRTHPVGRFIAGTAVGNSLVDWTLFATLVVTVDRLIGGGPWATALVLLARIVPGVVLAPLAARRIDRRDLRASLFRHEVLRVLAVVAVAGGFLVASIALVIAGTARPGVRLRHAGGGPRVRHLTPRPPHPLHAAEHRHRRGLLRPAAGRAPAGGGRRRHGRLVDRDPGLCRTGRLLPRRTHTGHARRPPPGRSAARTPSPRQPTSPGRHVRAWTAPAGGCASPSRQHLACCRPWRCSPWGRRLRTPGWATGPPRDRCTSWCCQVVPSGSRWRTVSASAPTWPWCWSSLAWDWR
jgi:hypothetical protein